jgi:hypothetical protein
MYDTTTDLKLSITVVLARNDLWHWQPSAVPVVQYLVRLCLTRIIEKQKIPRKMFITAIAQNPSND